MPQVLTTNAIVLCPHGGKGTSISTNPKWSVHGGKVLVEGDQGTLACPFVPSPCVGYVLKSMGLNATKVDGRRVVLVTDFNQTLTGLPLLITETHQVVDNTTPAPLPPDQPAPPLSPELADTIKPIVAVVPPAGAAATPPPLPPPVIFTFTIMSQHPRRWILTMVDEILRANIDMTNGLPPGIIVVPSGGSWTTSSLTIVVTLTPLFLAPLPPGKYHFFLTAVNQRGLNTFSEAVLTKT